MLQVMLDEAESRIGCDESTPARDGWQRLETKQDNRDCPVLAVVAADSDDCCNLCWLSPPEICEGSPFPPNRAGGYIQFLRICSMTSSDGVAAA